MQDGKTEKGVPIYAVPDKPKKVETCNLSIVVCAVLT